MESFVGEVSSCESLNEIFAKRQQAAQTTLQDLLSATRQIKHNLMSSLSGIPAHPYELIKAKYLNGDCKILTIDDVPKPDNFCPTTCSQQICSISLDLSEEWNLQVSALSGFEAVKENEYVCNAFVSLSENAFFVDQERAANHVQFIEMIKNIPPHLFETKPVEIAEKIVSQFINFYKK